METPRDVLSPEGYAYAPFLLRLAAATTDAAFLVLATILIYYLSYGNSLYPNLSDALGTKEAVSTIYHYEEKSGLFVVEDDGVISYVSSDDYTKYESAIQSYYFVYQAAGNPDNPNPRAYTVKDYNVKVLGLPENPLKKNESTYFDFALDSSGEVDATKLGVLKASCFNEAGEMTADAKSGLLTQFRDTYYDTIDLLFEEDYIDGPNKTINNGMTIVELVSVGVPFLVFYLVIPLCSRYGETLGKRFMKLALIDVSGKPVKKPLLALRAIPFVFALLIGVFLDQLIYSVSFATIVFLISMGCAIFTKRKRALHDYLCGSEVTRRSDAEGIELMALKKQQEAERGQEDR